jgi:hypothetical protein
MSRLNPQLLYKRNLVHKVLGVLNALHPLPSKGIVAGQAVASAIDQVLHTGTPVFNDIDVFLSNAEWDHPMVVNPHRPEGPLILQRKTGRWKSKLTDTLVFTASLDHASLLPLLPREPEEDYEHFCTNQSLYTVNATERDGFLNRILVEYRNAHRYYLETPAYNTLKKTCG